MKKTITILQSDNTFVYCVVGIWNIFTKFLLNLKLSLFCCEQLKFNIFEKEAPNVFYNSTTCWIMLSLQQLEEKNAFGACVCASVSGARLHIEAPRVVLFIKFHLWHFFIFVATGVAAYNFYLVLNLNPTIESFA